MYSILALVALLSYKHRLKFRILLDLHENNITYSAWLAYHNLFIQWVMRSSGRLLSTEQLTESHVWWPSSTSIVLMLTRITRIVSRTNSTSTVYCRRGPRHCYLTGNSSASKEFKLKVLQTIPFLTFSPTGLLHVVMCRPVCSCATHIFPIATLCVWNMGIVQIR